MGLLARAFKPGNRFSLWRSAAFSTSRAHIGYHLRFFSFLFFPLGRFDSADSIMHPAVALAGVASITAEPSPL
jgi:hypothetical protein